MRLKRMLMMVLSVLLAIAAMTPAVQMAQASSSYVSVSTEDSGSVVHTEGVEQLDAYTPVDMGAPIQTPQTIDAAFGQENGANVVYTTVTGSASSGDWARFNVIDIDNQKLLGSYPLEGSSNSWSHVRTNDGRVYIGASKKMFMYSPVTKSVVDLGVPISGTESIWALTADENGNVYGGIYSASIGGRVFRIDANTSEITDLLGGRVDDKENYVRSIAYYKGYVYAGTGTTNGRVWKIDPATKAKERLELPGAPSDPIYKNMFDKMGAVYGMTVVDHYLFAFFNGPFTMHVYDMDAGVWREQGLSDIRGTLAVTPAHNGKVYTSKKDKWMWEIDVATLSERQIMPFDGSIRSSAWIQVANQPQFTGPAMATISFDGKVVLYDPPAQKKVVMRNLVEGLAQNLQSMEVGADGNLYISSYMGSNGVQYNPQTDEYIMFPLGQSEGMGSVGDTLYFGVYPGAEIHGWDTSAALPTQLGPPKLFAMGNDQDRPFVLREAEGKLLIGTIPGYSSHGGALTVYDPAASKSTGQPVFEVYRHIVENQSITGLAYKDGVVFGSTSIHGGLGSNPLATKAKLFAWDMSTKKKLHEWDLQLEGLSPTVPMISGLTVGPDGLIWGAANGFIFAFDPNTRAVVKSKHVYPTVGDYGKWRPVQLRWGTDGLLYTNLGSKLTVLHPVTMESKLLADKVNIFALDRNNFIYYADATRVKRLSPYKPTNLTLSGPASLTAGTAAPLQVMGDLYGWGVDLSKRATIQVSNPSLARVEDGQIIPLQEGTLTLTATFRDRSSDALSITIGKPQPVLAYLNVKNGGFEVVNQDGTIPGWSERSGKQGYTSITSSAERAKKGTRSLKLVDASTGASAAYHSDFVEVIPGRAYTTNLEVYLDQPPINPDTGQAFSSSRATAQVRYYDAGGKELAADSTMSKNIDGKLDTWHSIQITNTAPPTAKYMRVIAICSVAWVGTIFFDDVTVSTVVDPNLLPKVEVLPLPSQDFAVGTDVTLTVKAASGSEIQVREGDLVVASGIGAGDTPVELAIAKPTAGVHQYSVIAAAPGLGFGQSIDVPSITVHELTGLQLNPIKLDLVVGGVQPITVMAIYGPLQRDVSAAAALTANPESIVNLDGNTIKGLTEGETAVTVSYDGKQAQLPVTVSKFGLQSIQLELPKAIIYLGDSIQANVTAVYTNMAEGGVETRTLTTGVEISSSSTAVAAVNGFTITGNVAGEAVITALYNGKEATATLRVLDPQQPVKHYFEIPNAGFEEVNEDGSIPNWSFRDGDPNHKYTSFSSSTEQAKTGSRSLKLIDASTKFSAAYQSELIEVQPNREYTAEVQIYHGNPPANPDGGSFSSSRTSFQVRYYDASRKELVPANEASHNLHVQKTLGRWHPVEIKTTAPSNAKYIRLILFTSPLWVSTSYYDNASVYTMVKPEELLPAVALAAPLEQTEYLKGSDVILKVKATQGATVKVLEGDTVVAEGMGEGENLIELVIAKPALGAHNYSLVATVPAIASSAIVPIPTIVVRSHVEEGPESIRIELPVAQLTVNSTVQASVYGQYKDSASKLLMEGVTLSAKPEELVAIHGLSITGAAAGNTVITATYGNLHHAVELQIVNGSIDPIEEGPISIGIELPRGALTVDQTVQAAVYGVYKDSVKKPLIEGVTLSAKPERIVEISGWAIKGLAPGVTVIQATYGNLSSTTELKVVAPEPTQPDGSDGKDDLGPPVKPTTPIKEEQQVVTVDQLTAKQGTATITMKDTAKELLLPTNTAEVIAGGKLQIAQDALVLELPTALIRDMIRNVGKQEGEQAYISFTMEQLTSEQANAISNQVQSDASAQIRLAGGIVRLELGVVSQSGAKVPYSEFKQPVKLRMEIGEQSDASQLGIYFIAEDGKLEFVGGRRNGKWLEAELNHFSNYGVFTYSKSYTDVANDHWAITAIRTLSAKHVVDGVTATEFNPSATLSRAQFVTMLVRALAIQAAGSVKTNFTDVEDGAWYAGAVEAAVSAGIVNGIASDRFDPHASITREQMALMLVRAHKSANGLTNTSDKPLAFIDASEVSDWAKEAVQSAVGLGWMQGKSADRLDPANTATRAESAMMIYNVMKSEYR